MEPLTPEQTARLKHLRDIGHSSSAAELEASFERQRRAREQTRRTRLHYFGLAGGRR